MIGLGLSITQLAVRQLVGQFNPMKLFALGEQGAWYDPSDLSTLYQDAAGTTPVTAVEQPVGLMLDKSKGLVLGPELVVTPMPFVIFRDASISSALTIVASPVAGRAYKVRVFVSSNAGTISSSFRNVSNAVLPVSAGFTGVREATLIAASTAPITLSPDAAGVNMTISEASSRELPGAHAFQTTSTSRPVLKQDAGGQYYLRCDGIDDGMVTSTITPGTDKAQVFAGVRKLSDAARGVVFELSTIATNTGTFYLTAPQTNATGNYGFASTGASATVSSVEASGYAAPITNVLTGLGDIGGDRSTLRINGTQVAQSTSFQLNTNYLAHPLYLFRRGGTTLPFNGHFYGAVIRFGDNLPIETIQQTEAWMAAKTGVTL